MYAIFKGETLVALEHDYLRARLVQLSTGNPLEFYVIKVNDLVELRNVMSDSIGVLAKCELNLAH